LGLFFINDVVEESDYGAGVVNICKLINITLIVCRLKIPLHLSLQCEK